MLQKVKVIASHGYFKRGEVLEVVEVIPYRQWPRLIEFLIIKGGNTIPMESVEWHYS